MGASTINLVPSAAVSVTGTGTAQTFGLTGREGLTGLAFSVDYTAVAAAAGDKLDVFIQTLVGATWVDVAHAAQVLGNASAQFQVLKINRAAALGNFATVSALAGGAIRDLFSAQWRARWVVVDAGAAAFTFSVDMHLQ